MSTDQSSVKRIRRKPKFHWPKDVITAEEFAILLRGRSGRGFTKVRDRALLTLLYRGALRISEALSTRVFDFELQEGFVRCHWCKGQQTRVAGIDPITCQILNDYMILRDLKKFSHELPFFLTAWGTPLRRAQCQWLIARLKKQVKITKRVHLHGLRHSSAYDMVKDNIPIHLISRQLGHKRIATTEIYLDHINPKELIDAVRKRTWNPMQGLTINVKSYPNPQREEVARQVQQDQESEATSPAQAGPGTYCGGESERDAVAGSGDESLAVADPSVFGRSDVCVE